MSDDWRDLSAILTPNEYRVKPGDPNYGATEPLQPLPCRCESPWIEYDPDDGERRCVKCGARP